MIQHNIHDFPWFYRKICFTYYVIHMKKNAIHKYAIHMKKLMARNSLASVQVRVPVIYFIRVPPLVREYSREYVHANLFHATNLFLYPLEVSETSGFLTFSGGIEKDQWHETGQCLCIPCFQSSRSQMFFKKSDLKNFTIFTGKHLCCSLFIIKA